MTSVTTSDVFGLQHFKGIARHQHAMIYLRSLLCGQSQMQYHGNYEVCFTCMLFFRRLPFHQQKSISVSPDQECSAMMAPKRHLGPRTPLPYIWVAKLSTGISNNKQQLYEFQQNEKLSCVCNLRQWNFLNDQTYTFHACSPDLCVCVYGDTPRCILRGVQKIGMMHGGSCMDVTPEVTFVIFGEIVRQSFVCVEYFFSFWRQ